MDRVDVVVVGAGAAGLMCAGIAGQRGLSVRLIDHAPRLAEKIRISGGGRCNFTNRDLDPRAPQRHFLGDNPHFCRSALSGYTPADFMALLSRHGVAFHEKHRGQMFCDRSAQDVIDVLLRECEAGGVQRWQPCAVHAVRAEQAADGPALRLAVQTDRGQLHCRHLVVATGGLSIPKIGASDWGHRLARQFGLRVVPPRPALVPLTCAPETWQRWGALSGLSLPVRLSTGGGKARIHFDEDLLFTHRGLSGPAALQVSSYWSAGQALTIDLLGGDGLAGALLEAKARSRRLLVNELATRLPSRLAEAWVDLDAAWQRPVNEVADKAITRLAEGLRHWSLTPDGTEGYAKAEVTAGGVDTRDLSSRTLESTVPGLYFIGEVVDVTGWLGGYNFQWAWASAHACAMALDAA